LFLYLAPFALCKSLFAKARRKGVTKTASRFQKNNIQKVVDLFFYFLTTNKIFTIILQKQRKIAYLCCAAQKKCTTAKQLSSRLAYWL